MGLTQQQVQERIDQGLTNESDLSTDKTTKEIIISNTFTYFNLIFLIITVLLCLVGSFRNLTFLPIVIGNTLIGIIQEVRAKRTLDKMNLLNAPHAIVVRDGVKQKIETEQLVQDDEIILEAGNQICADAVVVEGSVQVNESLLTGEADEVEKNPGDELFSGSFVVSGRCHAELTHVGNESYIAKLSQEAKTMGSGEQSEMIRSINQIVKWVGIVIIPIGLLLFYQSHFINHETIRRSVTATVAAIIGMIPEGLYLLTTIALALSTMKLASRKVLLHDMKSIEALARVDVLCVDKTGTITEPTMNVKQIICSKNGKNLLHTPEELQELLVDYTLASNDNNATMQALRTFAGNESVAPSRTVVERYPFSSTTKYGAIVFTEGTYILGAPEFVMGDAYAAVEKEISTFTKSGDRVLLFAKYAGTDLKHGLTEEVIPLGFVILANPIRENAKQTFEYFNNQGVAIKVISGDTPVTVSEVARQAGIAHAEDYIDASTLKTPEELEEAILKYTVFGRVTPDQKRQFVQALKKNGKTVAMTGDGVNDVLALKDADCSVAMASGSDAAAQAAQLVLLDNDFSKMPSVVLEGRRVVNNLQRSGTLFLVKNIFSFLLSIFSLISMVTYPLEPSQISLISMFTIGIPGFLLSLMPNKNRIEGHFITNILTRALPAALTDFLMVATLVVFGQEFAVGSEDISTAATVLLAIVGFMILYRISKPLNWMRWTILIGSIIAFIFCSTYLNQLFAISDMSRKCIMLLVVFSVATEPVLRYLSILVDSISSFYRKQKIFFLRKREARKAK